MTMTSRRGVSLEIFAPSEGSSSGKEKGTSNHHGVTGFLIFRKGTLNNTVSYCQEMAGRIAFVFFCFSLVVEATHAT
jgi:hypothetical protein